MLPPPLSAADIVEHALKRKDPLCLETPDCFCGMLGTVASNVALTLVALDGVYLGVGVMQHLGDYFHGSLFRERFEKK